MVYNTLPHVVFFNHFGSSTIYICDFNNQMHLPGFIWNVSQMTSWSNFHNRIAIRLDKMHEVTRCKQALEPRGWKYGLELESREWKCGKSRTRSKKIWCWTKNMKMWSWTWGPGLRLWENSLENVDSVVSNSTLFCSWFWPRLDWAYLLTMYLQPKWAPVRLWFISLVRPSNICLRPQKWCHEGMA